MQHAACMRGRLITIIVTYRPANCARLYYCQQTKAVMNTAGRDDARATRRVRYVTPETKRARARAHIDACSSYNRDNNPL